MSCLPVLTHRLSVLHRCFCGLTVFSLLALLLLSCSGESSAEERASEAAVGYYQRLIQGDYEGFLTGLSDRELTDSLDPSMETVLRQFMAEQQEEHRGILDVRIASAHREKDHMDVFLVLCFGDSTNEEVLVPMVERQGNWLMK